ncbi:MAG: hypothetical protein QOF76_794 [Solirubrobacteraceae bacterium]|nr:hypothetical protein [Solirubrobacteraceae bacterium]
MSRLAAAFAVCLACLVAGCGGGTVAFTEVKTAPPTLPIPRDVGKAVTPAADTSTSATPTPTPTVDTSTDTSTAPSTVATQAPVQTAAPVITAAPTTDTGGAAPPGTSTTAPGSSGNTAPSTGGATADDGLDQFCSDNPGACNTGN